MKQITITLPDKEAMKFVSNLMDMAVTFTVTTTVATDPMVFAALETPRVPDPDHEKDPANVERGLAAAQVGKPIYARRDRPRVQRLTPEGFTSMQIVEAKVKSFNGRRFSIHEVMALAEHSGFKPDTLKNQLQIMVAQGKLVTFGKQMRQEVRAKRASPLPNGSQPELPLTDEEASTSTASPEVFQNGEGWREPA